MFTRDWLIDDRDYERCEYYNDRLRPQGIYHLLGGALQREGPVSTILTVTRSRNLGEFNAAELSLSRELVPHLQRATEMHQRLFAVTRQRDAMIRGLDGLRVGAILVSYDGRLRFANRVAEAILREGDGLTIRHGRLETRTPALMNALYPLIGEAARTGAGHGQASGGVLALPRLKGGDLHVLVCPFPMTDAELRGPVEPTALVFAGESGRKPVLRPPDLVRLYGLSPAEAKLVSGLTSRKTLDEYAETAGITLAPAKSQLQQIFAETGWHRQSDVIRGTLGNGIAQIASILLRNNS